MIDENIIMPLYHHGELYNSLQRFNDNDAVTNIPMPVSWSFADLTA